MLDPLAQCLRASTRASHLIGTLLDVLVDIIILSHPLSNINIKVNIRFDIIQEVIPVLYFNAMVVFGKRYGPIASPMLYFAYQIDSSYFQY